jgi:hypothetical protein
MLQHRTLPNQGAREKVLASFPPGRVRALSVFAPGDIWEIGAAFAQSAYNINSRPAQSLLDLVYAHNVSIAFDRVLLMGSSRLMIHG